MAKEKRNKFFLGIVDKDEFWQKSVQCLIRVTNIVTSNKITKEYQNCSKFDL